MADANPDLEAIGKVDLRNVSSVYGPVRSWRVGHSLGVDLLCVNSICSFNCVYCQLGSIQVRINRRALFVPTAKVEADLRASRWREADIVTFSGNGEPTLALNLGESIRLVKRLTGKPTLVLTSGSLLHLAEVRSELAAADRVYVKLDAATEASFQRVNRPVEGVTLAGIIDALLQFRSEYLGVLGVQSMFLNERSADVGKLAALLNRIRPDEVQLNTPSRPYPRQWVVETRGSHGAAQYEAVPLKGIDRRQAARIETRLRQLTGGKIPIRSFHAPRPEASQPPR